MKRKNLEKAIVLSLILITGVYGSAWAQDIQSGGLWTDANKEVEAGDNLIITTDGVGAGFDGTMNVKDGNLTINSGSNGILAGYKEDATVTVLANNVVINSGDNGIFTTWGDGFVDMLKGYSGHVLIGSEDRRVDSLIITAGGQGIDNKKGSVKIFGSENSVIDIHSKGTSGDDPNQAAIYNAGSGTGVVAVEGGYIKLTADKGNGITNNSGTTTLTSKEVIISASVNGISNSSGNVKLNTTGQNIIKAETNGVTNTSRGTIDISADTSNTIAGDETGLYSSGSNGTINVKAENSNIIGSYTYKDETSGNLVTVESKTGIKATRGNVNLTSTSGNNSVYGTEKGIDTTGSSSIVTVSGSSSNAILAGDMETIIDEDLGIISSYGKQEAINAVKGSTVTLNAGASNVLYGAVYAADNGTNVTLSGGTNDDGSLKDSINYIYSYAVIDDAGGLNSNENTDDDRTVISALYAEGDAQISLKGENIIGTYAVSSSDDLERAVWAYDKADINIDGATVISTDSYEKATNSKDIAVAAGTATDLTEEIVNTPVDDNDRAKVTIKYDDFASGASSDITGDILSAYAGMVNIYSENENAGINIKGNLFAGNNGKLDVDLGNGGTLEGRIDDYGDADEGHLDLFNPAFSSDIYAGGDVNLTMGDGSRWNVTGQSWVTSINTNDAENVIIDLVSANTDLNTSAHALTVGDFTGNAAFNMSLKADRDFSDMLYIKNANGNYVINVYDAVSVKDMYADGFDGLRFATVGKGSSATFSAITLDSGFNNIEYEVDKDLYDGNDENKYYNGDGNGSGEITFDKPGDNNVNDFFDDSDETEGIMTIAEIDDKAGSADEANSVTDADETTNFKLVGVKSSEISDGGKTILNMSRANYSNAIYMDRLNKRLGEARYINSEEDEGMWVRIRHDRIGKDDAYRSQNTMYELGYDQKQECDNGERRVGMAIDYMHGDTGYNDIAGKGEIDRYGLWLYDTWMGDKGHYADYVAKWGHLSNDFEIYNSRGEVTGDYSNNVFSVSAEYGRKKDIGNDWYFEPQVQAQLARVTGADYTTNQGTKVSVDGINSLIGRAGFRLGKDFGEEKQSTVYIKADVLHEFLGDQDIRALDGTTSGWQTVSYENEGTWYDVGLGFAAMMSKSSYAFLDLERSFGHDNDETYQINVGMQWSF